MSITTETNRTAELTTDGVETDFDFSMLIHSASEVEVWYKATGGSYSQLTLNTDYGIVFTGLGGTVSTDGFIAPLAAGTLLIIRHIELTQQTNWLYNDNHSEQQHQDDFDRSVMRDLQIQEQLDRAVGFAITSPTVDIEFPEPLSDNVIGWNTAATALENKDLVADIVALPAADGNFIVGDGTNFVVESGDTARASMGVTIGTDVLAWQAIGIEDDYLLEVDGTANSGEYARFTANGLEGRTVAELGADGFLLADGTIDLTDNWTIATNSITLTAGTLTAAAVVPTQLFLGGGAGVFLGAGNGILLMKGQGDGEDESLFWDFNTTANTIGIDSDTGVTMLNFNGLSFVTGGSFVTTNLVQAEHLKSTDDIEVADDIFHSGEANNNISFGASSQIYSIGGVQKINITAGRLNLGSAAPAGADMDVVILKSLGDAMRFDRGSDFFAWNSEMRIVRDNLKLRLGTTLTDLEIFSDGTNGRIDTNGKLVINSTTEVAAKIKLTAIGGYAVLLTNKTGGNTVAGQLVIASTGTDDAFASAGANSDAVIGVVLDAGIADDSEAWVVESGVADTLIDAGGCTHGDRMISSATAGSADVWNVGGAVATHFLEIGHCLETRVGAGLVRVKLHFN